MGGRGLLRNLEQKIFGILFLLNYNRFTVYRRTFNATFEYRYSKFWLPNTHTLNIINSWRMLNHYSHISSTSTDKICILDNMHLWQNYNCSIFIPISFVLNKYFHDRTTVWVLKRQWTTRPVHNANHFLNFLYIKATTEQLFPGGPQTLSPICSRGTNTIKNRSIFAFHRRVETRWQSVLICVH